MIFYVIKNILSWVLKKKQLPRDTESYIRAERLDPATNRLICFPEEDSVKKQRKLRESKKENRDEKNKADRP